MIKAILPKPSSKEMVIFSDTSVCYGDVEIKYKDAVGISFFSSHTSGTVSTFRSYVCIRSAFSRIDIKISKRDFLGFGAMRTRYDEICAAVIEHVAPIVADKILKQISGGGTVQIGKLTFDKQGITASGFFGSRRRVLWSSMPETRIMDHTFLSNGVSGTIEISYLYHATGKMVVIGNTSSRTENGYLVPRLIRAMNSVQQSKTSEYAERSSSTTSTNPSATKTSVAPPVKVSPKVHECLVFINDVLCSYSQQRIAATEAPSVVEQLGKLLMKSCGDTRIICNHFDRKMRQELRRSSVVLDEIINEWERDIQH